MKAILNSSSIYHNLMGLQVFVLLLFLAKTISGGTIVTKLPGFDDELPFKLETGYVGVGENEVVQLFYYFVESQRNPSEDPLVLSIPGGPSCSSFVAFFFEYGPLKFDIINYVEGLPKLILNEYAWTQSLNIIYLDGPVGAGFSYSKTVEGYNSSDSKFAANIFEFLLKWFKEHPQFLENQLYLAGEGYSGNLVPLVAQYIMLGSAPIMNIKGFLLGNPGTDKIIDMNSHLDIYHRLALIPDHLYYSAYENCNGNFSTENPSCECNEDKEAIDKLIKNVNPSNILQPACNSGQTALVDVNGVRRYLTEQSKDFSVIEPDISYKQCSEYTNMVCEKWANNQSVQNALHIREGTGTPWQYCNDEIIYVKDISSVLKCHQKFTTTDLQALIYSGDHDPGIPYVGTLKWIRSLNLTIDDSWRPWNVDNEIAGYTARFTNNGNYNLTYATVKGAGHFAAGDKVKECSVMVNKWMAEISL